MSFADPNPGQATSPTVVKRRYHSQDPQVFGCPRSWSDVSATTQSPKEMELASEGMQLPTHGQRQAKALLEIERQLLGGQTVCHSSRGIQVEVSQMGILHEILVSEYFKSCNAKNLLASAHTSGMRLSAGPMITSTLCSWSTLSMPCSLPAAVVLSSSCWYSSLESRLASSSLCISFSCPGLSS